MDEQGFRRFLKRMGKEEHVVDGLVAQVQQWEAWLTRERRADLDGAGEPDVAAYVASLKASAPGHAGKKVRGLSLYYRFAGCDSLAAAASALREQEIAPKRRGFPIAQFRGIDPADAARLEAAGIVTADEMIAAGRTPAARERLAADTGVAPEVVLELVKLSDLARMGALKAVRARLYYDAGVDTPEKLAGWEPEALVDMLAGWVARTEFDGIAPLPKEVRNGVAAARRLPRLVEY